MLETRRELLHDIAKKEGHGDIARVQAAMGFPDSFPPRRALVARRAELESPSSPTSTPTSAPTSPARLVRDLDHEVRTLRKRVKDLMGERREVVDEVCRQLAAAGLPEDPRDDDGIDAFRRAQLTHEQNAAARRRKEVADREARAKAKRDELQRNLKSRNR